MKVFNKDFPIKVKFKKSIFDDSFVVEGCDCCYCRPITLKDMRFVVCPECHNKRCPKAQYHGFKCTNSNEANQKGELG